MAVDWSAGESAVPVGAGARSSQTADAGDVARRRRLLLVALPLILGFGAAFVVGTATRTSASAPGRIAPAVSLSAVHPGVVTVDSAQSLPPLRVPKTHAAPAPTNAASAAPAVTTPVVTTPTSTGGAGGVSRSTPSYVAPPVTTAPSGAGSPPATSSPQGTGTHTAPKPPGTTSTPGTGIVSGGG